MRTSSCAVTGKTRDRASSTRRTTHNHKGHEVTRRSVENKFLRDTSCPSWLLLLFSCATLSLTRSQSNQKCFGVYSFTQSSPTETSCRAVCHLSIFARSRKDKPYEHS